jgi:signal transduction histidine kinase
VTVVLVILLVATVLALVGVALLAGWLWRERREVRELVAAEPSQPTTVALKRILRQRVHRDELSAALFSREALLEATPLPVLVISADGTVARANGMARVALGPIDAGSHVSALSPELDRGVQGVLHGPPVVEVEVEIGNGDRRVWLAHLRSHPDGEARAAVVVLVDVTSDVDYREARRLFSASVSHELRTPLQRIVGLVDTLALPLSELERDELVYQVETEVQRMRELVDEMLLLAALDRGEAALTEGSSDAGEVAVRVVTDRRTRPTAEGRTVTANAATGLRVPVGEQLLEVVIGNLVDNALKHAGAGAHVAVAVQGRGGEVEIVVEDTGVGIAPEHLPHVFERFFRADGARSTAGSGLGLAVVKHIIEAHGGRAMVESPPGAGAKIRLQLPEVRVALPDPRHA